MFSLLLPMALLLFFKKQYLQSNFIFFFVLSSGFGMIPDYLFIGKNEDVALIYVLVASVLVFLNRRGEFVGCNFNAVIAMKKYFLLIFLFLLIAVAVDVLFRGTAISDVIKYVRRYFFLLSLGVFSVMERSDAKKLLKLVVICVIFQTLLYDLQPFVGHQLLLGGDLTNNDSGVMGMWRFYNSPLYMLPLLIYSYFSFSWKIWQIFLVVLGTIAIVLGSSRGAWLSILLSAIVWRMFSGKTFISNLKFLITLCFVVFAMYMLTSDRLSQGTYDDVVNAVSGNTYDDVVSGNNVANATFSFRIAMLRERIEYLRAHPMELLIGSGFVHEYSRSNLHYRFDIGTDCPGCAGGVSVMETPDIAWVGLLMRIGMIGTFLYILMVMKMLTYAISNKRDEMSATCAFVLIEYLFSSFGNSRLADINYYPIMFFMLSVVRTEPKMAKNEVLHEK